jgi:hypothetical protein
MNLSLQTNLNAVFYSILHYKGSRKMARKKSITQDDINQICTIIIDEGEEPTLLTIRERLGGTGSYTTIQPFLKNWKEANKENTILPPLPEKMKGMAIYSVNELWKFAAGLNKRETANLKALHDKELEDLNKQLTDTLKLLYKATIKNEKLTLANQRLAKENRELESKMPID